MSVTGHIVAAMENRAATGHVDDTMIARIMAAVDGSRAGDQAAARDALAGIWTDVGVDDPFHLCVVAHHLADLQADPAQALMWDTRALDAAERASADQVVGFYPSLYLNIADDLRRLGSFAAAAEHVALARDRIEVVGDDAYGDLVRSGIAGVAAAIEARSTAPSPTAPGS